MTATITWTISAMDCYPTVGSETDVVFTVHWTCSGVQDTYSASLNQAQVLGWIWANGVDQTATEAAVQSQINGQINPTVVTPPLPWTA